MKKYPIGTKLKHKCCNLLKEVMGYKQDLFGEYVLLKIIDKYKWLPYHYYGKIETCEIGILNEYEVLENE